MTTIGDCGTASTIFMDPCGDAAQGAGIGSLATALTWTRAPLAAIGMLAAVVGGSTGQGKWVEMGAPGAAAGGGAAVEVGTVLIVTGIELGAGTWTASCAIEPVGSITSATWWEPLGGDAAEPLGTKELVEGCGEFNGTRGGIDALVESRANSLTAPPDLGLPGGAGGRNGSGAPGGGSFMDCGAVV